MHTDIWVKNESWLQTNSSNICPFVIARVWNCRIAVYNKANNQSWLCNGTNIKVAEFVVEKLNGVAWLIQLKVSVEKCIHVASCLHVLEEHFHSEKNSWFYFSGVVSCDWFDPCCCDSSSGLLAGRLNLDPSGSTCICNSANIWATSRSKFSPYKFPKVTRAEKPVPSPSSPPRPPAAAAPPLPPPPHRSTERADTIHH